MKHRKQSFYLIGIIILIALLAGGITLLNTVLQSRLYGERKSQMEALTQQLASNFDNAMTYNWACVNTAEWLLLSDKYDGEDDIVSLAQWLNESMGTDYYDCFYIFLDESGYCYDETGRQGIWGDFDQAVTDDRVTFVADSASYDGVQWAFVKKLKTPVTLQSEDVTITYLAMLKDVDYIAKSYKSATYEDVCETYLLKENGTRMYDSTEEDSILQVFNIYKFLRESPGRYTADFSEIQAELDENGVAGGNFVQDGVEYCYGLAALTSYQTVLMFVIPAKSVATNTVSILTSMMILFVVIGAAAIVLIGLLIIAAMSSRSNRLLYEQREENMVELEASNEALEEARVANSAKSTFLSNMSHDIRTPLNAILGFTTLIEHDAEDADKVRRHAGKLKSSGNLLLGLINNILDMSKIESGKTTLALAPMELDELMDSYRSIVTPMAEGRGQAFVIAEHGITHRHLIGDKGRINQIMMNLLSNAVKYTPQGGHITMDVEELASDTEDVATLRFTVADDGIGMSEEYLQTIFEPFTRENDTLTNPTQGTGLGMAITKELTDLMGGTIEARSTKGEGSTFVVIIPLVIDTESQEAAALEEGARTGEEPADAKASLQGKHFLAAEDNEFNSEILEALLNMAGATVDLTRNGKEAAERFEASEPGAYDAILMDVQMPVMNGYEATRHIRASAHPEAADIPIIAMTANAFTEDVQNALDAGMTAHISKPLKIESVAKVLAKL